MKLKSDKVESASAKTSLMKGLFVAAAIVVGVSVLCMKRPVDPVEQSMEVKATETVAYLSDLELRVPMFVIPVNYTTDGNYTGFELKATTNRWDTRQDEAVDMQYYAQSDALSVVPVRPRGEPLRGITTDAMRLYACMNPNNSEFSQIRSTTPIASTSTCSNKLTSVTVLIDTTCLRRYPEDGSEQDGVWMKNTNAELQWIYARKGPSGYESQNGCILWRPIEPVRWFRELPGWAYSKAVTNDIPQ